jgi:hypothetical protein
MMPLTEETVVTNMMFCKHCTKPDGTLQSREYVQSGIEEFLKVIEPNLLQEKARKRAEYFMKAMPAWTD